jgi:hypothetical protein
MNVEIGTGPRSSQKRIIRIFLAVLSHLPQPGAPFTRREERLRERVGSGKRGPLSIYSLHTDKNENQIFLTYKEIQN